MWHRVLALFMVVAPVLSWFVLIPSTPALAATTVDIVVTATPSGLGVPIDFTLTDNGAITVSANWTPGADNIFVMLRVSRDDYPSTTDSGELVYYGGGTSSNVTGFSLATTTYYWSAWGFDSDNVTHSATYATASIGGEDMGVLSTTIGENWLFMILGFVALGLTGAMFHTRNAMLGFPCAIFWALFGGYSYNLSTVTWDIHFMIAFASLLGMVTFTALGAYGLRERRDTIAEEEMEEGEGRYIDEGGDGHKDELGEDWKEESSPKESRRVRELHERAKLRRTGESHPTQKSRWR